MAGPHSPQSRRKMAELLGVIMIVDISHNRYPVQYIVDAVPADQIRLLPKAHWKVMR